MMTRAVITCGPNDEIAFNLRLMNTNGMRHISVLQHGKLISMISIRELTKAYELLRIEANIDPLTGLSNPPAISNRLMTPKVTMPETLFYVLRRAH